MTAIYARQSVDKADSISIETQIDRCKARLTDLELQNVQVYQDKGFSGKNTARPGFQKLLQDIGQGHIQKIIVYKLDRVSRSVHDFTGLYELLRQKQIAFISCEDGLTLDNTPAGAAMAQIMMVFAQFERETIIRRVTDNYYERAKSGMYLGGRPPFGFAKGQTICAGKHTACFIPCPAQAEIVAALFSRYLEPGASLGSLMRWLAEKQIRTTSGNTWSTAQLGRLLRNPAYVQADPFVYQYFSRQGVTINDPLSAYDGTHGCYFYAPRTGRTRSKFCDMKGGFLSLAPHEGFIPAEIWLKVQQKLGQNQAVKNSGRGSHSWLSGLMKCEHCGYAVTVVNQPAPHRGHYINCGGRKKGCCPGRSQVMTLEQIEASVQAVLLPFLRGLRQVPLERQAAPCPPETSRELVQLEQEIAQLTQNIAQITQPDVLALTAAFLHEKNTALARLREAQAQNHPPAANAKLEKQFAAIPEEWDTYTLAQKKRIAALSVSRVTVGDGRLHIVFAAGYDGMEV